MAKHFPYMRAHWGDIKVAKLIGQIAVFTGLLFPFFSAYGLSEYIGYQVGRRHLRGKMRLVYGLYLFGAAGAYLALMWLPPRIGMAKIIVVAFGCVGIALFTVTRGRKRILAGVEIVTVLVCLALPQLEQKFLSLYKGRQKLSTWYYQTHDDCEMVFQKWGRYSLCEVMLSADRKTHYGFYNDFFQWEYTRPDGFGWATLGAFPLQIVEPQSSRILIVGAGAGRQVRFASRLGIAEIVAVELEPVVFEAVRSEKYLRADFNDVYETEEVRPVLSEGRRFVESTTERFDLIYLPSVGGYPQMMLEPGNMIRTRQAYQSMMEKLTEDGFLAIWYPWGLDEGGILTSQYVRTLRRLGYRTQAYCNEYEYLILSGRNPEKALPDAEEITEAILVYPWLEGADDREKSHIAARPYTVHEDPWYVPVTDEKPFLGGNIRNILSISKVFQLYGFGGAILAAAGLVAVVVLRRRGDPQIAGRSYWSVAGLAFLLGANFLLIEHYLVVALFRRCYVYFDALMLGAISFLVLTGLGSLITGRRLRPIATCIASAAIIVLLVWSRELSATAVIALIAPVALVTGSFFPALFDLAAKNPLAVFALDAIGAGFGALAASLVPITFGLSALLYLAGAIFLVTAAANTLFHYRLAASDL
ncbi:MAG: spermine/spermidine synthase domain-containing protein [Planctomycetota bacterium]